MAVPADALLNTLRLELSRSAAGPEAAPLHQRPPCATVAETDEWPIVLAATLAEAAGAHLVAGTSSVGTTISFAGEGTDPARAEAAFVSALAITEGHSRAWCVGFAAAVDEELDAMIDAPTTRARVARVARWLEHDGSSVAPMLEVRGRRARAGADRGRWAAREASLELSQSREATCR